VAQDKEIGRVPLRSRAPQFGAIGERNLGGLIVIFQHIVIALHAVDRSQLHMAIFKLDEARKIVGKLSSRRHFNHVNHNSYQFPKERKLDANKNPAIQYEPNSMSKETL
jgi:xanthosine utilization system XapX-like protein